MKSKTPNLDELKKIHFIGIGGVGMSALAQLFLSAGKNVSGSDSTENGFVADLKSAGAEIFFSHAAENLAADVDLVIFSNAIDSDNVELLCAQDLGISIYSMACGIKIFSEGKTLITVSGTHGKTTVTGFCAAIASANGLSPCVFIGARVDDFDGKNYVVGEDFFIVEACEYKNAFLELVPDIAIITNVEADHLDFFKTAENYFDSFTKFVNSLDANAALIVNGDDQNSLEISAKAICRKFEFSQKDELFSQLNLRLSGAHNRMNALAALKLVEVLGLDLAKSKAAVENFGGAKRRLEEKGFYKSAKVIDDYAHHPTEVKASLQALREKYPQEKILFIYQPHQLSRSAFLLEEFRGAFDLADWVLIPNIYEVRDKEADKNSMNSEIFAEAVAAVHGHVLHAGSLDKAFEFVKKHVQEFDLIVTAGAGDITLLADQIVANG
jgi:UDP-N-acetylmuramate--alanine ligase